MHLSIPITRKAIRHVDSNKVIDSRQAILVLWAGKSLSYNGHIQLIQLVFRGNLKYILQSSLLLGKILRTIKSISYRFILGTQNEVKWLDTTFPRSEGALG